MRTVPVRPVQGADSSTAVRIAELLEATFTLEQLLRWANAQELPVPVLEIITQDEYTHDVILPFGAAFLAFDTT